MAHKKTPAAGGAAGAGKKASSPEILRATPAASASAWGQRPQCIGRSGYASTTRRFKCSGIGNPCPICGRTKDGDCRWGDNWIACHTGPAANKLTPGQTVKADGCTWYLSRTGGGHSGIAHVYRHHRAGQRQKTLNRAQDDLDLLAKARVCRRFYAELRPRVHAALRLPPWVCCTAIEMRLVADTFDAVQQLIHRLQHARRADSNLASLMPIARRWLKTLGYHLADLKQFQRKQLGMQEGWR